MIAQGVAHADRVAIWEANRRIWIWPMTCGAAIVPLNTWLKVRELGDILRRTKAKTLCCVSDFLGIDYRDLLRNENLPAFESTVLLDKGWDTFSD